MHKLALLAHGVLWQLSLIYFVLKDANLVRWSWWHVATPALLSIGAIVAGVILGGIAAVMKLAEKEKAK